MINLNKMNITKKTKSAFRMCITMYNSSHSYKFLARHFPSPIFYSSQSLSLSVSVLSRHPPIFSILLTPRRPH